MTDLDFYAEVRVVDSPDRPGSLAKAGAILGIAEPADETTEPTYAVLFDGDDRLIQFRREQIEPTGQMRKREDYY
ncbi:hypothetical protein [Streptomyces sp. NPDC101776]|uniref:hypothetical protein n=1 Tax=Streptomyces sp. NPDC101776 TaxID=3366146 RepID=UPI0038288C8F